ncbi:MAG: DUF4105 domain-containing protein [Sphaerochaetaceae bacterium]|nr:DUF4105 domain-containing protein [Sphaerochaetaceae bacterium]
MKKALVAVLLLLILLPLMAQDERISYDSEYMLDNYFSKETDWGFSDEQLDRINISIFYVTGGDILYQWFGHMGILVESPDFEPILFDYGRFEFGPDFYINFAMGRLWYKCMGSYASYQMAVAEESDRSVYTTRLNLSREEKSAVLGFLNINSSSEFNTYLYHNYRDNCSTRVRDIFDRLTDGQFKQWALSQSGYTYRQRANMVISRNLIVLWVLDFLQGRNIDKSETLWENMFLPVDFFESVSNYPDSALTGNVQCLYEAKNPSSRPADRSEPLNYVLPSLAAGIILGLVFFLLLSLRHKSKLLSFTCSFYGFTVNLIFAVISLVLFFMMFFTLHDYTYLNENILFANPVLFLAAAFSLKPQKHKKGLTVIYSFLLGAAIILILLKLILPSVFIQDNWPQLALLGSFYILSLAGLGKVRK